VRVKDYYRSIAGEPVKDYKIITDDVRMTVFEGETAALVNYGDEDYFHEGNVVKAKDFLIING